MLFALFLPDGKEQKVTNGLKEKRENERGDKWKALG